MTKTQKAGAKLRAIMANPVLWARYFLKITDKTGQLVPFEFSPQQLDLVNNLQKYNLVLKSRQLGLLPLRVRYLSTTATPRRTLLAC